MINLEENKIKQVLNYFNNWRLFKMRLLLCMVFGIKIDKNLLLGYIESQTEKGLKKYNRTIIDCRYTAYNWNEMLIEEIIDAIIYKMKRDYIFKPSKSNLTECYYFNNVQCDKLLPCEGCRDYAIQINNRKQKNNYGKK